MKIVIDIDEKDYQSIKNGHIPFSVLDVLMNGTPLPEHHGRIIDESKIHKCGWDYIKHHAKTDAPTIIEGSESE